jgi:hypothetical protein
VMNRARRPCDPLDHVRGHEVLAVFADHPVAAKETTKTQFTRWLYHIKSKISSKKYVR